VPVTAASEVPRGRHLADVVILVTGLAFALGVVLLATAVWVDLPGPLSAYGHADAAWPIGVQVVLGALAFGAWRWINRRRTRPYTVVLLALGIAVVIVLASSSYARCPDLGQSTGWSVVTRVIGLITNNYAVDMFKPPACELTAPPLALQFARLAQLVVLLVAATSAVLALLRTQMDRIVVKSSRRTSLVVGVDNTSATLLPALAAGSGDETLAVLTPDPLAPWLGQARAAGWRVVVGDRWDETSLGRLLTRPRGRHALGRVAVLPPDSTEAHRLMTAVQKAVDDASTASGPRRQVRVLLRMDDAWQAEDWRRRYLGRTEEWVVDTVSENEVTARLLVEDVLQRRADLLLVSGHSDLTFAVAAEIAQQARERAVVGEGPAVPALVLVDEQAQEVLDEHVLAQARFGNSTVDITVQADDDVADVVAEAMDSHRKPALLFTGDVHVADQRLAARLGATYPSLLVYSRRTEVSGLGAAPLLAEVRAFGTTLDAGVGRPIDNWERMARRIHEAYLRKRNGMEPTKESQRPWDELSQFYRESNVRQVLTVMSSAVVVGRSWGATTQQASPPSDEQLDTMVRLEQQSWRDYYESHGWAYGAERVEGKTHPDLLPWEQLNADSQRQTRDGVLNALALLEALGYRSFDDPERQWRSFRRKGEVTAVRREEPWSWKTSDGTELRADAGDWEVRDAAGSRSVQPDIFEVTHEHVEGDRWRRVGVVHARRAVPGEVVHSLEGKQVAGHDHWVMRGVRGEEWLVSSQHLQSAYDPVEELRPS
jgi:hypothetical protein